jgi:hypothetical protein
MHPAFAALSHQPGGLQGALHPRVTQPDVVLLSQLLVKMPHVEIRILLLIQPQNLFLLLHLRNNRGQLSSEHTLMDEVKQCKTAGAVLHGPRDQTLGTGSIRGSGPAELAQANRF